MTEVFTGIGTTGFIGSAISTVLVCYKLGMYMSRKNKYGKLAKYIYTKILNQVKDNKKIMDIANKLKKNFSDKSLGELKKYIQDLINIEKENKKHNMDKFFEENKDEILKNIDNINDYFVKKRAVDEFSLSIFARIYDTKIKLDYFKQFKESLIEDCVLNVRITPDELNKIFGDLQKEFGKKDLQNFDTIKNNFEMNKKEILDVLSKVKGMTNGRSLRRFVDFIKENIEDLNIDKKMITDVIEIKEEADFLRKHVIPSNPNATSDIDNANKNVILNALKNSINNIENGTQKKIPTKRPLSL